MTAFAPHEPVPPVNADDLKRVWDVISSFAGICQNPEAREPRGAFGIDLRLLEPHCEPGSDVTAVSIRAFLLRGFLKVGLLDDWREGDGLRDTAFRVAATFPIEHGVERLDLTGFLERLRR